MSFKYWFSILKKNKYKLFFSIIFLIFALLIFSISGDYITDHAKNYVTSPDLILDNLGPYNLSFIFIWLFLAVIFVGLFYPLIFNPNELPYFLNLSSFLIIVRSGFVIFTHLKVPVDAIVIHFPKFLELLNFTNDLFFSGHVAISFLGFLAFKEKPIKYFMLASSIILGVTVLLMHVHYSIDVLSAYFITYGVYIIGNKFFKK